MNTRFRCRSCNSTNGSLFLDLGLQPLANNLLKPEDLFKPEPKVPLRLEVCEDCWLLQITDLVPPVTLFSEYLYFSSFSEALLKHSKAAAERYIREFALNGHSHVIEIASNDGYMLQTFQNAKIPCTGIEPASNIAEVSKKRGIKTVVEFFGNALATRLATQGEQADLILGNNVFAHAPETNDFTAGLATLLKQEGNIVLEFPYAVDLIEHTEFDTIYHEHVFYFTLSAVVPLFERHRLEIFRVERIPIHGGSLRLFASHAGARPVETSVTLLLNDEKSKGVNSLHYYEGFADQVREIKRDLCELLGKLKAEGKALAAYGASAKGSTLLNYFGIGKETLEFVADRSTHKQGRLTPGMHIPILPPEKLLELRPEYTLLLTWNFAEEILSQQQAYRESGGRFIVPIPKVKLA